MWFVIIRIRLGLRGRTRSTVLCSMLRSPVIEISCLGRAARESGQNLVPDPPASMTMYMAELPLFVLNSINKIRNFASKQTDRFGSIEDIPQCLAEVSYLLTAGTVAQTDYKRYFETAETFEFSGQQQRRLIRFPVTGNILISAVRLDITFDMLGQLRRELLIAEIALTHSGIGSIRIQFPFEFAILDHQ